jgi:uncharacterized membrane protein
MLTPGIRVYGLAALALGFVGLAFADFAGVWQPVPEGTPARAALACLVAALFVLAGLGLQFARTARIAVWAPAALYLGFALLWLPRVAAMPGMLATWLGVAEQFAMALGGLMAWATLGGEGRARPATIGRLLFGLCLLVFGAAHFVYLSETAALVPTWLPPGPRAWAGITGGCDIAAGLALLSGRLALIAARLVTAMFVGFGLLVWLPQLFAAPGDHIAWAGNAVNLALVAAAWAVAEAIARFARPPALSTEPSTEIPAAQEPAPM